MNHDDLTRRIRELEKALRRAHSQSERYKFALDGVMEEVLPYLPRDVAFIAKLRAVSIGQPISEILEDLEEEFRNTPDRNPGD